MSVNAFGRSTSNTESTRQPSETAASLRSLRSRLTTGSAGEPIDGLVDPFAEVFAAMAIARPVEPTQETDRETVPDDSSHGEAPSLQQTTRGKEESSNRSSPKAELPVTDDVAKASHHVEYAENAAAGAGDIDEARIASVKPVKAVAEQDANVAPGEAQESSTQNVAPETITSTPESETTKYKRDSTDKGLTTASAEIEQPLRPSSVQDREAVVTEGEVESAAEAADELGWKSPSSNPDGRREGRRRHGDRHDDATPVQGKAAANSADPLAVRPRGIDALPTDVPQTGEAPTPPSVNTRPSVSGVAVGQVSSSVTAAVKTVSRSDAAINAAGRTLATGDTGGDTKPAASAAAKPTKSKGRSAASNSVDAVFRAKLVQRVSKAFQSFGNQSGSIRLRLAPAELGSVQVDMRVRDKQVEARIVAESEAAAAVLREQLPDLRQRLEAGGMKVDRFVVETETQQTEDVSRDFDQPSGHQDFDSRQSKHHRRSIDIEPKSVTLDSPRSPATRSVSLLQSIDGGVDVLV